MVVASFYSNNGEHELMLFGHAEGSPEVCAAASAIVYALAGWVENNREHLDERKQAFIDLKSGDACLLFTGDVCADAAFQVAEIGLAQLANSYPDYISCLWAENS